MTGERININIAKEFSSTPGPRQRSQGDHSGQEFLEDILRPKFEAAIKSRSKLHVDLDGAVGYPTSFLEEAFGGLARAFNGDVVERTLEFTCNDEPYLKDQILKYIRQTKITK